MGQPDAAVCCVPTYFHTLPLRQLSCKPAHIPLAYPWHGQHHITVVKPCTAPFPQISNVHAIGVTAVSWAPAVPAGGLVASQPPAAATKRLCTAGCDNTVKVSSTAGSCS